MDFLNLPSVDAFLRSKGIDVYYNTLGATDEMIQRYVYETHDIVDRAAGKTSHFVKSECYALYYDFEARPKYTGFEKYDELFLKTRLEAQKRFASVQFSPTLVVENKGTVSDKTYLELLSEFVSSVDKEILLYLSGGTDSEFVARTLINAGIEFTPVIYRWKNSTGAITNIYDIVYAYRFCKLHNLLPIMKDINIDTLWSSEEFLQLTEETRIESAQLNTHIYMCLEMNNLMPEAVHLFGGEVRYRTNFVMDDSSLANLVMLGKVTPGFNGQAYTRNFPAPGVGGPNGVFLLFSDDGTWQISADPQFGGSFTAGGPTSGTFAVAPLAPGGYQYRYSSVTSNIGPTGETFPTSDDPTWLPITGSTLQIAYAIVTDRDIPSGTFAALSVTIDIRPASGFGIISASVNLGSYVDGV